MPTEKLSALSLAPSSLASMSGPQGSHGQGGAWYARRLDFLASQMRRQLSHQRRQLTAVIAAAESSREVVAQQQAALVDLRQQLVDRDAKVADLEARLVRADADAARRASVAALSERFEAATNSLRDAVRDARSSLTSPTSNAGLMAVVAAQEQELNLLRTSLRELEQSHTGDARSSAASDMALVRKILSTANAAAAVVELPPQLAWEDPLDPQDPHDGPDNAALAGPFSHPSALVHGGGGGFSRRHTDPEAWSGPEAERHPLSPVLRLAATPLERHPISPGDHVFRRPSHLDLLDQHLSHLPPDGDESDSDGSRPDRDHRPTPAADGGRAPPSDVPPSPSEPSSDDAELGYVASSFQTLVPSADPRTLVSDDAPDSPATRLLVELLRSAEQDLAADDLAYRSSSPDAPRFPLSP
jgi:hypothetical protein